MKPGEKYYSHAVYKFSVKAEEPAAEAAPEAAEAPAEPEAEK